ncbi:uncharacterized protein IWR1 (Interacts With RNA polymerase II) homologue, putative [Candida dubliniensis CD36]|uniref:Uncharacterized protein IWR1 (Interacts With RNA polymerase II) homologue, putative n=1 Tax=Candida dubliniensis (strain CD36 / ATCC MYA-646 / CBS 7987 / NCPF 3949 / NRRL Y-17841) TaxID=573826 RepID=B9WKA0_CANDC|nr:uncharacterized protein IWR1 (Interacts With RNA polymerase II) homologue, putative [Candida dubliniensis CD36]CAX40752.1 uncharacterized protein IWR1 (Interacts With RNA polymerase II) homologue, putative [Candida dubliniensis CD36]
MFNQPPKILRIKRKRHQDPLQALILEDRRSVKRSKPSSPVTSPRLSPTTTPVTTRPPENHNYVFKLARTDESNKVNAQDESIIQTILSESQTSLDDNSLSEPAKRNFVIPKHQTEEDIEIPNELSDMLDSFLSLEKNDYSKRRKRGRRNTSEESSRPAQLVNAEDAEEEEEEEAQYVYDVYHLTDSEPMTSANHPSTQIGYIRFFEDENETNLLMNDEEDETKPNVLTDDEDSNAESFYQNDYPSDEDAGAFSEQDSLEEDEGYVPHDGVGFKGDDEYFDYEELENLNAEDNYYEDEAEIDESNGFKRNQFFKSDVDDPMAIHRDKVFNKLENMINNK